MPAKSLLDAVTYPMVQPDDVCCVRFCSIGIVVYSVVYLLRLIWNASHFFDINPIQDWITKESSIKGDVLNQNIRTFVFFFVLFFDFIPSIFAIISVYLFKKHDMMFNENPYYTRQSD